MIGVGFGVGVLAGLFCGAALVRYGFGLSAKLIYQVKEDLPLLESEYAAPLEQISTDGATDLAFDDEE